MSIGVGVDEDCVVKLHVRPVFIASSVGPASRRVGVICSALLSCYNLLIAAVHSLVRFIASAAGHTHCCVFTLL